MKRVLCVLALGLAGCGGPPGPVAVHPVSGQVIYDGKPQPGVQVWLIPTNAPMVPQIPHNPGGVTGADGRFKLGTYAADDGAAEGTYQVMLRCPVKEQEDQEQDEDLFLNWYSGVNSKLKAKVKAGPNDLPPFTLPKATKPPEVSKGVPGRN